MHSTRAWPRLKDHAEAVRWYRKAAEQNDVEAQYFLSVSYESGLGVAKDSCEAYKWPLPAATQGHEDAKNKNASKRSAWKGRYILPR